MRPETVLVNKLCLLLMITAVGAVPGLATDGQLDAEFKQVLSMITEQCGDCHNANTQEGTVNLLRFESLDDLDQDRPLWKTVFDVVEAGQMPLPQSGYELTDSQRHELLLFIKQALARPDPKLTVRDPGKPILRRLTRLEYNNTVRDLFGVDYDLFMFPERLPIADKRYFAAADRNEKSHESLGIVVQTSMREYGQKYDVLLPQLGLPGDNRAEYGYSNRGDALNFSPLLFEKVLQLAAAISNNERLLQDSSVMQELLGVEPPPLLKTNASKSNAVANVSLSGNYATRERIGSEAAENDTPHSSFVSELTAAFELGSGGTFDIPQSLNNQSVAGKGSLLKLQLQGDLLTINPNVDVWLAAFATAVETSGEHLLTNRVKGEKVFELTFGGLNNWEPAIQHLGVCVLSRRQQSGTVQLTAVLSDGQRMTRNAVIDEQSGNVFFSWMAPPGQSIKKLAVDGSAYSGDHVLLDDVGFIFANPSRPLDTPAQPPVERHVADLVGPSGPMKIPKSLEQRITSFLGRAYRRPATDREQTAAMRFIAERIASGDSEVAALRRFVQCVLSSPEFLFLAEPVNDSLEPVRRLDSWELANRLSYFLWSSMPDSQLREVAAAGGLDHPAVMREQVSRMLADRAHIRELSESFAVQWLRLDQLYSSKPDRQLFKAFYSGPQGKSTLHGPMMTEALLLFETVLVEDLSIMNFYDADFTWLNSQLAQHYDLQDAYDQAYTKAANDGALPKPLSEKESGNYWLRTQLPDRTRGGVMTMAGPLTLTSLPFRTSPIKRGAWLLETVFNRPPAEPKVAFVLEEAVANSTQPSSADKSQPQTIRQLFEIHRSDPNCYSCHSRIDPPGFSLEVFDAMGSLRTHDGQQPVDASGTWNSHGFTTPAEFKDAIRLRESELARGFVEHLLSYALGRKLEHFDMQAIDQIVSEASVQDYRLSVIVEGIALSYPFQHVRNQP